MDTHNQKPRETSTAPDLKRSPFIGALILISLVFSFGSLLFPRYLEFRRESLPGILSLLALILWLLKVPSHKSVGLFLVVLAMLHSWIPSQLHWDWPGLILVIFAILFLYLENWPTVIRYIREIKVGNTTITLGEKTEMLDAAVERAEQTIPAVSAPTDLRGVGSVSFVPEIRTVLSSDAEIEKQVLDLATRDKVAALVRVSIEIEKELYVLHGVMGLRNRGNATTWRQLSDQLLEYKIITPATANALIEFRDVRNRAVHWVRGDSPSENVLSSSIDSGLRILRILKSTPRPTYSVFDPSVVLYRDASRKDEIPDVRGVILQVAEQSGSIAKRIYPAGRVFKKGETVGWDWDMSRVVGPAYYLNPESGKVELAWSEAAAFVGKSYGDATGGT